MGRKLAEIVQKLCTVVGPISELLYRCESVEWQKAAVIVPAPYRSTVSRDSFFGAQEFSSGTSNPIALLRGFRLNAAPDGSNPGRRKQNGGVSHAPTPDQSLFQSGISPRTR